MRIIGGDLKGRKIEVAAGFEARPTTDFAKEGLFNMLGHRTEIEGAECLDLCCGTGSIGLELISRGAKHALMIDWERSAIESVKKNLRKHQIKNGRALRLNALDFIEKCTVQYDLVFTDPPYQSDFYEKIVAGIVEKQIVKKDGWLIVEHDRSHDFSDIPSFEDYRKFGKVHFSLFHFS